MPTIRFLFVTACFLLQAVPAVAGDEAAPRQRLVVFWADSQAASCVGKRDLLVLHDLIEERLHRNLPADDYVVIKGPDLISMMESYEGNAKSASCTDQSCMQIARKAQADLFTLHILGSDPPSLEIFRACNKKQTRGSPNPLGRFSRLGSF